MSEVAQKVPFRDGNYPGGTVRPEKCQRTGSGARRGRLGLGRAQAPVEEGRQGHGCSCGSGGPGEENAASSQGRKERDNLMAVTNEQRVQITQRGKERGVLGAAEAASSRSGRRATSKGLQVSKLISGCWKGKQSNRKAALHVGCDPDLAAVSTTIPIHLCGLTVRPED